MAEQVALQGKQLKQQQDMSNAFVLCAFGAHLSFASCFNLLFPFDQDAWIANACRTCLEADDSGESALCQQELNAADRCNQAQTPINICEELRMGVIVGPLQHGPHAAEESCRPTISSADSTNSSPAD